MPKIKVYGIHGLYEWKPVIKVGHATFSPHFEGGTIDKNGVTPARYTSTNKVEQTIIENSSYYKNGRIFLMCESGEDDEPPTNNNKESESTEKESENKNLQPMSFASVNDAVAFMMENYGYMRSQLPSKRSIQDAGKEQGLLISFTK